MELVPESIQGTNTLGLDGTFQERLISMGVGQLIIDFANEIDMLKLSLWLEQFGVPPELLPENIDELAMRDLLRLITRIYKTSGTDTSIKLLAVALGAESAEVVRHAFVLDHDGQARHNGMFQYDVGREYRSFAVDVNVYRVMAIRQPDYEVAFRKMFQHFQPVHLFLRDVVFI